MYTIISIFSEGYGISTASNCNSADRLFAEIIGDDNDLVMLIMYGPEGRMVDCIPDAQAYRRMVRNKE